MMMDTSENYRYDINEDVLCHFGQLIYEAKCLQRRMTKDGSPEYYINIKGWKDKFNVWVRNDSLLEVNNTNMRKMAIIRENHVASQQVNPRSAALLRLVEEKARAEEIKKKSISNPVTPTEIVKKDDEEVMVKMFPFVCLEEDEE